MGTDTDIEMATTADRPLADIHSKLRKPNLTSSANGSLQQVDNSYVHFSCSIRLKEGLALGANRNLVECVCNNISREVWATTFLLLRNCA